MNTAEANFRFPVLGFTPDREIWGFADIGTLTSCGPRTRKENLQAGMELVGADGARWIVRSVRRVGRAEPLIPWLLSALLTSTPQSRVEHELDRLEPITLREAQARACASLKAFPQDYGAADEDDPALGVLLAQVNATRSIGDLHELLGLDSFMAY
jgi:hypothetical protein